MRTFATEIVVDKLEEGKRIPRIGGLRFQCRIQVHGVKRPEKFRVFGEKIAVHGKRLNW